MPNTVFQLRRNTVSGTRPTTTTVSTGELAINTADGILFSANTTAIFEVGANNTNIRVTGNATINAIVANGSTGSNGQVLLSNGTGIYWGVDSINTAAQFTFSNTITFSNVVTFSTANVNFDSNTLVIDGDNNRVGVGTATPSSPLHVVGDTRTTSINSGPLAGFRNAIINGNFDFWQRGTSYSNPADGAYTSDRWFITFDGTGATRTISRQVFTLGQTDVPSEPTAFYRFNQSVAGNTGTFNVIVQRIEGVRTFAGQEVTVSFFARGAASLTMPFIILRQSFGTGGSPSADVVTSLDTSTVVGTTFTRFTFSATLPSISGKTLGTNGNDILDLLFFLPINTTFTFDLASVQIELGPVATPFERRPLGTELALCQRYFSIQSAHMQSPTTGFMIVPVYFPVTMRAVPTGANISVGTESSVGSVSISVRDNRSAYFQFQASVAGGFITDRISSFSAEL